VKVLSLKLVFDLSFKASTHFSPKIAEEAPGLALGRNRLVDVPSSQFGIGFVFVANSQARGELTAGCWVDCL
jgi:hypothetical protein